MKPVNFYKITPDSTARKSSSARSPGRGHNNFGISFFGIEDETNGSNNSPLDQLFEETLDQFLSDTESENKDLKTKNPNSQDAEEEFKLLKLEDTGDALISIPERAEINQQPSAKLIETEGKPETVKKHAVERHTADPHTPIEVDQTIDSPALEIETNPKPLTTVFEAKEYRETPEIEPPVEHTNNNHEPTIVDEVIDSLALQTEDDSEPRVMVVEDDNVISGFLVHMLTRRGFDVQLAEDGREATKMLDTIDPPRLVILDIMLPFIDGFELIKIIRSKPEWEKIPILMLTSKTQERDIVRALDSGANDYIFKPFQSQELIARVDRFMR